MNEIILVDEKDNQIGLMDKLEVHQKGLLHRAFSIFIFNSKKELLLQCRAANKYHSGSLWSNTCCSHPQNGENLIEAAKIRLQQEMGFTSEIKPVFTFIYKAQLNNNLTEHEFDHVFFGEYNAAPKINTNEVSNWHYKNMDEIKIDLQNNPQNYTVWFAKIFDKVKKTIENDFFEIG